MSQGLLALALGAGMLAAVNPCGFALLPAYVSLLLARDGAPTRLVAVGRALSLTSAMTLGFAAVFLAFGLVVAPVASQVQQHLPWVTVVLGLGLVLMGAWLLAGRSLSLPPALQRMLGRQGSTGAARPLSASWWSMTGFGAGYALASLTCTIAPFLAVVVVGFRSGSAVEGLVLLAAYTFGMGLVVGTLAVATALASPTTVTRLRRAGGWAPRAAGLVLVLAGAYVAWYAAWELRVLSGAATNDPVVEVAASVQRTLVNAALVVGPGGFALLLAALVAIAALSAGRRRRARSPIATGTPEPAAPETAGPQTAGPAEPTGADLGRPGSSPS